MAAAPFALLRCLEPTEIVVAVGTTFPCEPINAGIIVSGRDEGGAAISGVGKTCKARGQGGDVGTLTLVPAGADDAVRVRVVAGIRGSTAEQCAAGVGVSCIEASRLVRFVSHQALRLPIDLDLSCLNVKCPAGFTCKAGACVPEELPKGCTDLSDPKCSDGSAVPPIDASFDAAPPDAGTPPIAAAQIAAGGYATCALAKDGKIWCWGEPGAPQLLGGTGVVAIPSPTNTPLKSITVGGKHACVSDASAVYCWGDNAAGQCGTGQLGGTVATPTKVTLTAVNILGIAAGGLYTCAVDGSNVMCWGRIPGSINTASAQVVGTARGYTSVAGGAAHVCACDANGSLFCWGSNAAGQLGPAYGSASAAALPSASVGGPATIAIAGGEHSGWLGPGLAAFGFGRNADFEITPLNTAAGPTVTVPSPMPPAGTASGLAFGSRHGCSVFGGTVRCWGNNSFAQLGGGMPPIASIGLPNPATQVVAGDAHACALTTMGEVYCWGSAYGQGSPLGKATRIIGP